MIIETISVLTISTISNGVVVIVSSLIIVSTVVIL